MSHCRLVISSGWSRRLTAVVLALQMFSVAARATIDVTLQMQTGNPTNATADPSNHSHYLIQRPQYALDYDDALGEPNWVSWDLTSGDVGGSGRSNDFEPDPALPPGFYPVTTADYNGVGNINFNRGHMSPSEDRTDTLADNLAVFYMTNIVPQSADNNQGPWELFENYCRQQASLGNEILITSGPSLFLGSAIPSGKAQIPGYTWKIALIVPLGGGTAASRVTTSTRVIAIKIPNIAGIKGDPWENYKTTVAQITADTGFTFFTGFSNSIATALRNAPVDGQVATGVPTITTQPAAQTDPVGASATFSVVASDNGNPPLTYQWRKDGDDLAGATNATLMLTNLQATDVGNYGVVVTNTAGSTTSADAALVVTGLPPTITSPPVSKSVGAGTTVTFSVGVSGSPTITYQWRKAGSPLTNIGNVTGATAPTLTLSNVQAGDAASYDVVVTNSVNTATSTPVTLTVTPAAPTITTQPAAQVVAPTGTATFTVAATGTAPFTYQWRKAGTPISGNASATTATLTLTNVQVADGASYDVVVGNGVAPDATSTPATLTVSSAVNAKAYTGGTYSQNFDSLPNANPTSGAITLSGAGPFALSAAPFNSAPFNTTSLAGWSIAKISGTGANALFNFGTGSSNGGAVYSFGASGATDRALGALLSGTAGSAWGLVLTNNTGVTITQFTIGYNGEQWRWGGSSTASVRDKISFEYQVGGSDIVTGTFTAATSLDFSSIVTSGTSGALNGNTNTAPISATVSGISWAAGQTLVLRWKDFDVPGSDDGLAIDDFTFTTPVGAVATAPSVVSTSPAAGAAGVGVSSPITVTFNQPVTVAGSWFSISSTNNGPIVATVTTSDFTTFTFTPPANLGFGDTITVNLLASQITDKGSGTLHPAANTTFSFTTTADSSATAPTVTTQPLPQTVNVGGTATFTVAASGTAPLSYQWRKAGVAISGNASATTATLTLTNVATTDAGGYSCVVTNAAGSDVSTSATLTVNVPAVAPTITSQPASQTAIAGTNVTFTVVASGTAPLGYQWRKAGLPLTDSATVSGSATATLTLLGVSLADVAGYDVVVTNTVGSATSTVASLGVNAPGSSTVFWNFNTAAPTSGLPADLTGGVVTQNNNNGTTALLTTTSASNNAGASGGNNAGAAARIGALNTAAAGSAYFEFTLTPSAGEQVQISGLSFGSRSTSTGPQLYTVFTSADGFAAPAASGALANDAAWHLITPALPWLSGATSAPLTVRIFGSNGAGGAVAGTANWRIDDLKVAARGIATAPLVASTSPAAGDANVALAAPITITFNQPVAATAASFALTSAASGPLSATLTGGPTSFTLTPAASFGYGDTITVTVFGAQVTELNSNALTLGADYTFSFTTIPPVPPSIVTSPLAQTATVGDSVTFNVVATGTAPLGYQWRKGGVAIVGNASALTDTLALTGITTADAADYDCVVSNVAGSATSSAATLTVNKAVASVTLSGLIATYDGSPKAVTASTTPDGVGVVVTYDGSPVVPANAGSYAVVATVTDPNYVGSASGTLTINRAAATVTLSNLSQTYTGSPLVATATTAPGGLGVLVTYDGSSTPPTNAGSYAVVATIMNPNFIGGASGTLAIAKAPATIALSGLTVVYDTLAHAAVATTTPASLGVTLTYNGSATAPTNAGSYPVAATVTDANYVGSASGTLTINQAPATVTLAGLATVYDGTARVVTATTVPASLTVVLTYDGAATAPTNAGSYAIAATVNDANYTGSASGTLVVAKAAATIALSNTAQTYDGTAKSVTAATTPASLAVTLTYDGSATAPTNAGSYAIAATINDANYTGSTSGTLVVAKAAATIALSNTSQTYDGTAKPVTVTTTPVGLATAVTYAGSSTVPTNAGSYAVAATITDPNYAGATTGTLAIGKAAATVSLTGLSQTYDGTAKSVTVTTAPASLATAVTYAGSATAPTNAGSYPVAATITDPNYTGSTSGTLVVAKAAATIALSNTSQTYDGTAKPVTVTTTPVGLATAVTYAGSSTAPTNAGTYAIAATITDPNYSGSATGSLTIDKALATVVLSNLSRTFDGTPKSATATTTPAGLTVSITYNGSTVAPTAAGSYAVVALVSNANYHGSASGTLVIATATATITLSDLTQAYDGTPQSVTTTTTPAGLTVSVTYNGSTTAPTNPGSYAVVATITDPNYSATASGTLVITTTGLVRHAPTLDGGLDGSLQVLTGESFTLNGNAWVSGDILVPGTPSVLLNGHPTFAGTIDGTGSATPSNYQVTLNGNAVLRHLVRRTDPIAMPTVSAPPAPTGTRDVSINSAGQSIGSFTTLRNLTLNGNVGTYPVPAGTYGTFIVNGNSGLALGVAGATSPAVYNLQGFILNGNSQLQILGPVVIVLANGTSINAGVGTTAHPEWLTLKVASGGVTLNGNVSFSGSVVAPSGTVIINGNSTLTGGVVADRLTINGNGLLKQIAP